MIADILTKPLLKVQLEQLRTMMGLQDCNIGTVLACFQFGETYSFRNELYQHLQKMSDISAVSYVSWSVYLCEGCAK